MLGDNDGFSSVLELKNYKDLYFNESKIKNLKIEADTILIN